MWELPTLLIVAIRSQQEDEGDGGYPFGLQHRHPVLSYNYNKIIPEQPDLKPEQQKQICAYANRLHRESILLRSSSSSPKSSKEVYNKALKQKESSATTLVSVGAVYRWQSEYKSFDLDHTLNRFGTYPNDVAQRTAPSLGHVIPLTTSETLNDIASQPRPERPDLISELTSAHWIPSPRISNTSRQPDLTSSSDYNQPKQNMKLPTSTCHFPDLTNTLMNSTIVQI
ncbi:hypothetical protein F511_38891 [Dorcoceras hygrometricum]|uniref:Uncharacterized protein n=1 Tax=Dorcoceras hygrometricum TaxID=472368 RepID=A0A2Z7A8P6_9LAMI|nr:hypothetical protein F511_38891 [Dorcoceras hygrometricum]